MLGRTMNLLGYQSFSFAKGDTSDSESDNDVGGKPVSVNTTIAAAPALDRSESLSSGIDVKASNGTHSVSNGNGVEYKENNTRNTGYSHGGQRSATRRSHGSGRGENGGNADRLMREMNKLDINNLDDRILVDKAEQYVFLRKDLPKRIKWTIRNTGTNAVVLRNIVITNAVESVLSVPFLPRKHVLAKNEATEFELEVRANAPNAYDEVVTMYFDNARIMEVAHIVIKSDENNEAATTTPKNIIKYGRSQKQDQILRHYTLKVWRRESEVVPGQAVGVKRRFILKHLAEYAVPNELLTVYHDAENSKNFRKRIESLRPYMGKELTPENYANCWHTFLHLEEIELFARYRAYDMRNAQFTQEGDYLVLPIENLAERRPNLACGDIVRAYQLESSATGAWVEEFTGYDGIIHKVCTDKVLLKFHERFHNSYQNQHYRLEFHFSRNSFRQEHHAVDHAVKLISDDFLFPKELKMDCAPQLDLKMSRSGGTLSLDGRRVQWYNNDLNEEQRRAVHHILRGEARSLPYIIYGPPGTGKTITVVEAALQIIANLPNSRIVICTPSNSAADLIAERMINAKCMNKEDFVRLVGHNHVNRDAVPKNLLPYCATLDLGNDGTCKTNMTLETSGLRLACQPEFFRGRRVVVATLGSIGHLLQTDGEFTHVLIDEAGQCTEPQTLVPMTLLNRDDMQVVLTGDPKQLQSVIYNRYLADNEQQMSLLERVLNFEPYKKNLNKYGLFMGYNPAIMTKLVRNYRSLPSIVQVFNDLFYDQDLKPVVDATDSREFETLQRVIAALGNSKRSLESAVYFCGVIGKNQFDEGSPSFYNMDEANAVSVLTKRLYDKGLQPDNIGIVTPYSKQVKRLRTKIGELDTNKKLPKIGTVEEFQGQERDIIMVSTVRTRASAGDSDLRNSIGFVRNPKRMNVAISRARAFLLVFGDPDALSTDQNWCTFIDQCIEKRCYFGQPRRSQPAAAAPTPTPTPEAAAS